MCLDVYKGQLKTEVSHQLNFTIDASNTVSDDFISACLKQGECSHLSCRDLDFEAFCFNRR